MPEYRYKRAFDLAVATTALAVTAPLLAVAVIAIAADSGGPILFRHRRIGRGRREIVTLKLRTMKAAAGGPQITGANDARITRVGRILRRTKLDELPQLWNVIRGDMSIVGPRPEVADYVSLYTAEQQRLLDVRPGITDAASITFRNEEELLAVANDPARAYREVIMPLKLEMALAATANASLASDIATIAKTIFAIGRRGASNDSLAFQEARQRIEELNRAETGKR
jgi:lipopolysaccharide/colanic/teichoic acid biosynthesis glycosyltransferase